MAHLLVQVGHPKSSYITNQYINLILNSDTFRKEWPSLLDELVFAKKITAAQQKEFQHLNIGTALLCCFQWLLLICVQVGLVGSIDNDFSDTE